MKRARIIVNKTITITKDNGKRTYRKLELHKDDVYSMKEFKPLHDKFDLLMGEDYILEEVS